MKIFLRCTFLIIIFSLSACQQNDEQQQQEASEDKTEKGIENTTSNVRIPEVQKYEVIVDKLRLRDGPGEQGKVINTLALGSTLLDENEVSDFSTSVKLRGTQYNEPWIKVKTSEGRKGWVFPGGLRFLNSELSKTNQKLIDNRLKALFGNELFGEIEIYRKEYHAARNSESFAKAYLKGELLRDTLVNVLENVEVYDDGQAPQNLFWLNHALPGFITSLAAEGTIYYLFRDFKSILPKVATTKGMEDDAFLDLQLMVNATDSIEYFYPIWFMQTWDYGGHSLLGKGHHYSILAKMEEVHQTSSYFAKVINDLKEKMMNDITEKYITYWRSQKEIINELKRIREADFSVLTKEDKVAISIRLKMFENPEGTGLKMNLRTGN